MLVCTRAVRKTFCCVFSCMCYGIDVKTVNNKNIIPINGWIQVFSSFSGIIIIITNCIISLVKHNIALTYATDLFAQHAPGVLHVYLYVTYSVISDKYPQSFLNKSAQWCRQASLATGH